MSWEVVSLKLRCTSSSIHGSSQPPLPCQSLQFFQYCQGLRPCRCSGASANRRVVGNKVQLASRRKMRKHTFQKVKKGSLQWKYGFSHPFKMLDIARWLQIHLIGTYTFCLPSELFSNTLAMNSGKSVCFDCEKNGISLRFWNYIDDIWRGTSFSKTRASLPSRVERSCSFSLHACNLTPHKRAATEMPTFLHQTPYLMWLQNPLI